jgi:hypothetical protein
MNRSGETLVILYCVKPQGRASMGKAGCINKLIGCVPETRTTCPEGWKYQTEGPVQLDASDPRIRFGWIKCPDEPDAPGCAWA